MHLNRNLRILLYGANIWYFGEGMLGPLLAVFTERIGGDVLDITWAWATYLMVTGVLYILIGKLIDGKDSKARIMVIGYGLNALATFGYLFVSSTWQLLLVQACLGIAAALATPTWCALYAKYEDKKHDTYEWGLAGGEGQIITGIAILIGGLLVNYFSFTVLFVIMGTIQVIAFFYQALILKKEHPSLKPHMNNIKDYEKS